MKTFTIDEIKEEIRKWVVEDEWIEWITADLMMARFDPQHKSVENLLDKKY